MTHTSQIDHDVCIMMSFEEQVDTWFSEALQIADEGLGHWTLVWNSGAD